MELNFCKNCDNLMDLYSDEETKKLYLGCKACSTKEDFNSSQCIYSNESTIDLSDIINHNRHLKEDITLPIIKDNPNIKCPNAVCITNTSNKSTEINFIKYDKKMMSYMYICRDCNQKWTNR